MRQQAFAFDGVDDYVNIPDSPVLDNLSTTATLEAWIKPEVPVGAEAWLFARRDPFVSEGFSVALLQDGKIQLTVRTTTSPTGSVSRPPVRRLVLYHVVRIFLVNESRARA